MSFPSEIPQFWGAENPTDYILFKQFWEYISSNLNLLIRHVKIVLLLAACFICFIVVYQQAGCILMIFEIPDQFYWEVIRALDKSKILVHLRERCRSVYVVLC